MAAWLLFHVLVAAGGAWLARRYALRHDLVDMPGERRSHRVPTPRSGGIGIVTALLAGGSWLLFEIQEARPVLAPALAGFAAVAAVGLVDDHRPLSPWFRLVVHAIASGMLAFGTWMAWRDPWWAAIAFLSSMVLTNVWNFMDGIDGIAATQAMLLSAALACLGATPWTTWLALGLVAACAGFLPFNFPRARLFLGDVGSGAIGFMLATLMVYVLAFSSTATSLALLILPSAFLIDAGLTLAGRLRRGEPWWRPHALHAYQRWARRTGSHVPVTLAYAAWTAAGWWFASALQGKEEFVVLAACVAWYIAGAAGWWMLQGNGMHVVNEDRQ